MSPYGLKKRNRDPDPERLPVDFHESWETQRARIEAEELCDKIIIAALVIAFNVVIYTMLR